MTKYANQMGTGMTTRHLLPQTAGFAGNESEVRS